MNLLTPEQKALNDARCKAGAILRALGFTGGQRRKWLDARLTLTPEQLLDKAQRLAQERKRRGHAE